VAVKPGASASGSTLLGQNWDWLGTQRASLVLLRIRETDGSSCLTLTEAGMLAKIGLNDRGFGVCLNILRSTLDGRKPGVPVHPLLRSLLKCGSVEESVAFASALTFGASSNAHCADAAGDAAGLEFSPEGLRVVRGDGGTVCHTNHFLSHEGARSQAALAPSLSTVPRLERANALAGGAKARLGVADLQRILRDETAGLLSICRRPDPGVIAELRLETVASVVMDLGALVMYVAPDVPTLTQYVPVTLASEAVPA